MKRVSVRRRELWRSAIISPLSLSECTSSKSVSVMVAVVGVCVSMTAGWVDDDWRMWTNSQRSICASE